MPDLPDEQWLRQRIIDAGIDMEASGLSPQTSGNVSARLGEHMLITPSGVAYGDLLPEDIVALSLEGEVIAGRLAPSSEWPMHAAIYQARTDASAVVHAHSEFAVSLAVMKKAIPAFHYMVAVAGGVDIRCAPYATFGSPELAALAVEALTDRYACLLAHHGQITLGISVETALALSHEVETLARQYWRALQLGEPDTLDDHEMARVIEKFRTYGNPQRR